MPASAIWRSWTMHRSYRRFQTIWADLLLISESSDFDQDLLAVDRFLDWFKSMVDDLSSTTAAPHSPSYYNSSVNGGYADQSLPGDPSPAHEGQYSIFTSGKELPKALLRILRKFDKQNLHSNDCNPQISQLISKSLELIEVVLNDNQLRQQLVESCNINTIFQSAVAAASDVSSLQVKKFLIRLLKLLLASPALKQFTQTQAFQRCSTASMSTLALILTEDPDLTADIAFIFKRLLCNGSSGASCNSQFSEQESPVSTEAPSASGSYRSGGKLHSILNSRFGIVLSELTAALLNRPASMPLADAAVAALSESLSLSAQKLSNSQILGKLGSGQSLPTAADIELTLKALDSRLKARQATILLCTASKTSSNANIPTDASEDIRQVLCEKGCLQSFVSALKPSESGAGIAMEVSIETKIDMLESIVSLLKGNPVNNYHFQQLKGFHVLAGFIPLVPPALHERLTLALTELSIDGNSDRICSNLDAVELIIYATCNQQTPDRLANSLVAALLRLLQWNPRNAAIMWRLKAPDMLADFIIVRLPGMDGSERVEKVLSLLEFLGCVLCQHNLLVLQYFSQILGKCSLYSVSVKVLEHICRLQQHCLHQYRQDLSEMGDQYGREYDGEEPAPALFNSPVCRDLFESYFSAWRNAKAGDGGSKLHLLKAICQLVEINASSLQAAFNECQGWQLLTDEIRTLVISLKHSTKTENQVRDWSLLLCILWIVQRWARRLDSPQMEWIFSEMLVNPLKNLLMETSASTEAAPLSDNDYDYNDAVLLNHPMMESIRTNTSGTFAAVTVIPMSPGETRSEELLSSVGDSGIDLEDFRSHGSLFSDRPLPSNSSVETSPDAAHHIDTFSSTNSSLLLCTVFLGSIERFLCSFDCGAAHTTSLLALFDRVSDYIGSIVLHAMSSADRWQLNQFLLCFCRVIRSFISASDKSDARVEWEEKKRLLISQMRMDTLISSLMRAASIGVLGVEAVWLLVVELSTIDHLPSSDALIQRQALTDSSEIFICEDGGGCGAAVETLVESFQMSVEHPRPLIGPAESESRSKGLLVDFMVDNEDGQHRKPSKEQWRLKKTNDPETLLSLMENTDLCISLPGTIEFTSCQSAAFCVEFLLKLHSAAVHGYQWCLDSFRQQLLIGNPVNKRMLSADLCLPFRIVGYVCGFATRGDQSGLLDALPLLEVVGEILEYDMTADQIQLLLACARKPGESSLLLGEYLKGNDGSNNNNYDDDNNRGCGHEDYSLPMSPPSDSYNDYSYHRPTNQETCEDISADIIECNSILQSGLMGLLERLSARQEPNVYFSFDGQTGWLKTQPLMRWSPAKNGYTVSCWLQTDLLISDVGGGGDGEYGFITVEHNNSNNNNFGFMEFYFKAFPSYPQQRFSRGSASISIGSGFSGGADGFHSKIHLCVKSQTNPRVPEENFVFDAFDFASFSPTAPDQYAVTSGWHHLAVSQSQLGGMRLFIDGQLVQSCHQQLTTYPTLLAQPIVLIVGRRRYSDFNNNRLSQQQMQPAVSATANSGSWISSWFSASASLPVTATKPSVAAKRNPMNQLMTTALENENNSTDTKGFFRGLLGAIHITEGVASSTTIQQLYRSGIGERRMTKIFPSAECKLAYQLWPPAFSSTCQSLLQRSASVATHCSLRSCNSADSSSLQLGMAADRPRTASICTVRSTLLTTVGANGASASITLTHQDRLRLIADERDGQYQRIGGQQHGSCIAHTKLAMRDALQSIGGPVECLKFLHPSAADSGVSLSATVESAVKILANLINNDPNSFAHFTQRNGWPALSVAMIRMTISWHGDGTVPFTTSLFETLVGCAEVGGQLKRPQVLQSLMDWLLGCCATSIPVACSEIAASQQAFLMRLIAERLLRTPADLQIWWPHCSQQPQQAQSQSQPQTQHQNQFGLSLLLECLHCLPDDSRPFVLAIIDAMLASYSSPLPSSTEATIALQWTADDTQQLLDYLAYDRRQATESRAQLMALFGKHLRQNRLLVDQLRTMDALPLLIALLDCPSDRFRMETLRVIGVILTAQPKYARLLLNKIGNFEALWLFLASSSSSSQPQSVASRRTLDTAEDEIAAVDDDHGSLATDYGVFEALYGVALGWFRVIATVEDSDAGSRRRPSRRVFVHLPSLPVAFMHPNSPAPAGNSINISSGVNSGKFRPTSDRASSFSASSVAPQSRRSSAEDFSRTAAWQRLLMSPLAAERTSGTVSATLTATNSGSNNIPQKLFNQQLEWPETIKVVFDLLLSSSANRRRHAQQTLGDLLRILTAERNMLALWEYPWIDWFTRLHDHHIDINRFQQHGDASYPAYDGTNVNQSRLKMSLNTLVQRMIVCDARRRQSYIAQRGRLGLPLADSEPVHRLLTESLLTHFHSNPCLASLGGAEAENYLRNLTLLYRQTEDYLPFCSSLLRRFVTCINALMYHNGSAVRDMMKSIGLFAIRDEIVLRCLAADLPAHPLSEFLSSFSFDLVAEQPRLQDSDALIVLLLRLLHRVASSETHLLAKQILTVIVRSLLPLEVNRKAVKRVLDDQPVSDRLLSLSQNVVLSSTTTTTTTTTNHRSSRTGELELDRFIDWYFGTTSPDTLLRRQAIQQRLETAAMHHSTAFMAIQERALARRMKRLQQAKDKSLRSNAAINRVLSEFRAQVGHRLEAAAARHQQARDQLRRERYERRRLGENEWMKF